MIEDKRFSSEDIKDSKSKESTEYFVKVGEDTSPKANFKKFSDWVWKKKMLIMSIACGVVVLLTVSYFIVWFVVKKANEVVIEGADENWTERVVEQKDELRNLYLGDGTEENQGDMEKAQVYMEKQIENEPNEIKKNDLRVMEIDFYARQTDYDMVLYLAKNIDELKLTDGQRASYYKSMIFVYSGMGDVEKTVEYRKKCDTLPDNLKPQSRGAAGGQ